MYDDSEIRKVIQKYFDAGYDSSPEIADTMHDRVLLYSFENNRPEGELRIWDKETFVKIATSVGLGFPRFEEITSIDFTGPNSAAARVKVRVQDTLFTDILNFMCLDGKWQIVAKVFYGQTWDEYAAKNPGA